MTIDTLNQIGFIFNSYDNSIEELSYRDYLRQFGADETTSPRGVEPRIHVRKIEGAIYQHVETKATINENVYDELDEEDQSNYSFVGESTIAWELWSWGAGGNHPYKIDTYETEEEAELEMYDYFESYAQNHDNIPTFFYSKEDVIEDFANAKDKPYDVIERYVRIKEAADARNAAIKKELEEKEREFRTKQNAAIEAEAALLTPDTQLVDELKAIYSNPTQYYGNKKSSALSASFVAFLNRCGHVKVQSDFWKVFRIVSKKATL